MSSSVIRPTSSSEPSTMTWGTQVPCACRFRRFRTTARCPVLGEVRVAYDWLPRAEQLPVALEHLGQRRDVSGRDQTPAAAHPPTIAAGADGPWWRRALFGLSCTEGAGMQEPRTYPEGVM